MLLRLQNIILEMIAKGEPLKATMDRLCLEVEAIVPGTVCSVLTLDESLRIRPLSAPNLPVDYCASIDGIPIGPSVGSCGTAAFRGEPVSVLDIHRDPLWAQVEVALLPPELVACWSSPILDTRRRVLGTFAFYFQEHRGPTEIEERAVETCAHLCAIAIERDAQKVEHHRLAFTDSLTGLTNPAGFSSAIAALSREEPHTWGLLLVDLDNLKKVNDTFGHSCGDALIVSTANSITSIVPRERAFRLGGDEIAVIVKLEDGRGCIRAVAENILDALKQLTDCLGHTIVRSATIGGAFATAQDRNVEQVRRNADLALYHAKETRRGRFVIFEDGLRTTITRRLSAIRLVSEALKENRIKPFYQPIIRLDTGDVVGVEALCRIVAPDGQIITAADFQEATSDVLVSSELTQRIIAQVAQDVRAWAEMGITFEHVAINVTAADFHNGALARLLVAAFGKANVPLDGVAIEITESVYLGDRDEGMSQEIAALRALGICVVLDDFGTGFASLTHLLTVPIDMIKIDKSFIDGMEPQNASFAIVKGLISIASDLGIRVVAEGVESPLQVAQLRTIGCPLAQGYHFARPAERHEITRLMFQQAQRSSSVLSAGTAESRPDVASIDGQRRRIA
ncbi:MAG: EAL domain-containing protein [Rhizobiales bacterium]|nr:EAL domain-containing protein [Hyphomicrobiales bacterium]